MLVNLTLTLLNLMLYTGTYSFKSLGHFVLLNVNVTLAIADADSDVVQLT